MIKKISIIGGIAAVIIVLMISFEQTNSEIIQYEPEPEPEPETLSEQFEETQAELISATRLEPDVIMPTKVSRPGCEDKDRCYVPPIITIHKDESVTWQNQDSAFHSVTSGTYDLPTDLFDSGHLDPYQYFSVTFDEAGTFDYFCTLHPWMEGQIIVE